MRKVAKSCEITPMTLVRYTRTAVVLHWSIALLILVNVTLGLSGDSVPDDWARPVIDTHKSIGITVLGLVLMRILWRSIHPAPALPAHYPRWERWFAHGAHFLLYAVILALPISGWMHDSAWKDADSHPMSLFGLVPWPRIGWIEAIEPVTRERLHDVFGNVHKAFGYALYALVTLHIIGALKHQWFDRHKELQRMWL
jgi:cytochrome b561